MARRRQRPTGMDSDARRRAARATANEPREGRGQMTGVNKERGSAPPEWMQEIFQRAREEDKVLVKHRRYAELERQRIRLKDNGGEMTWGEAQHCVRVLRMIKDKPSLADCWAVLVALGKPKAARHLTDKVWREGQKGLMEMGLVDEKGLDDNIAKVVDASLTLTKNGDVVLVDPVAYTKEFVEEWAHVDSIVQSELDRVEDRLATEIAEKQRRKRRGRDAGPSL